MRNTKAFTLIELLVVIAVIAVLLSIILPSLKRAKELSQRIACSNNLKHLTLAWIMYAGDNNNEVAPCRANQQGLPKAWTGWNHYSYSIETQISKIHEGLLFQYAQSVDVYRCPTSQKDEGLRTYAMSCLWNPVVGALGHGKPVKKINELKNISNRYVFIDNVGVNYDAMFAVYYDRPQWYNIPNWRHGNGTNNSFGDGHVEYIKWKNLDLTVKVAMQAYQTAMETKSWAVVHDQGGDQSGNDDLHSVQIATWGSLGYPPKR